MLLERGFLSFERGAGGGRPRRYHTRSAGFIPPTVSGTISPLSIWCSIGYGAGVNSAPSPAAGRYSGGDTRCDRFGREQLLSGSSPGTGHVPVGAPAATAVCEAAGAAQLLKHAADDCVSGVGKAAAKITEDEGTRQLG